MKTIFQLFLFLILSALTSCSPSSRLNRLLTHHPELKIPDTIMINDTITIPQVEVDTVFYLDSIYDTIILHKDRLQITLNRIHDTLFFRGKCKADTIYIKRFIPVEKIRSLKTDKIDSIIQRIPWLVVALIATVTLIIFLMLRNK